MRLLEARLRMMAPLLVGLLASLLAAVRLITWIAVGCWGVVDDDAPAALPFALLLGAGITGCCYAMSAFAGHLAWGLAVDAGLAICACGWHHRRLIRAARQTEMQIRASMSRGRGWSLAVMSWTALAWLAAIAPPRDADVMRYHLAHIQQIVMDGRWTKVVDTAYAMPFGWSLTFLPFQMLHLPQGAQLLSLGAWLIILVAIHTELRGREGPTVRILLLGLACLPMVFKAVTTAHADAYTMLVMTVVGLQLPGMRATSRHTSAGEADTTGVRSPQMTGRDAMMLGFAAWIGTQARYQAIGIGLAALVTLAGCAAFRLVRLRTVGAAALGAGVAGVLAAPFYVANYLWFGNPVWPLLRGTATGVSSAVDRVAAQPAARMSAPMAWHLLPHGLYRLAVDVTVFPIPLVVAAAVIAGWWTPRTRVLAAFTSCYLVGWALLEPLLFPRFIIYLVPLVPLLAADGIARLIRERATMRRVFTGGVASFAVAAALLLALYVADFVRYDITGDRTRYDRATWFAPVFRWANASTDPTARFLVVVKSGTTYLLDRRSRPADPEASAEIDWSSMTDGAALGAILRANGYQYVIYEDRDWRLYPGGAAMMAVVRDAIARRTLTPVASFTIRLMTSRALRRSVPTAVQVLAVQSDAQPAPR